MSKKILLSIKKEDDRETFASVGEPVKKNRKNSSSKEKFLDSFVFLFWDNIIYFFFIYSFFFLVGTHLAIDKKKRTPASPATRPTRICFVRSFFLLLFFFCVCYLCVNMFVCVCVWSFPTDPPPNRPISASISADFHFYWPASPGRGEAVYLVSPSFT